MRKTRVRGLIDRKTEGESEIERDRDRGRGVDRNREDVRGRYRDRQREGWGETDCEGHTKSLPPTCSVSPVNPPHPNIAKQMWLTFHKAGMETNA